MKPKVIVDTGPLVAYLHNRDKYHKWVEAQLKSIQPPLLTCEAVISEATYLLRNFPNGPQKVLELCQQGVIEIDFDLKNELDRIYRLMDKYSDNKIELADACLIRMAELFDQAIVFTIDSEFRDIYRLPSRKQIPTLLPNI